MSSQKIGKAKGGKTGKEYEVRWDSITSEVFVEYAGRSKAGKASSASHAMNVAVG